MQALFLIVALNAPIPAPTPLKTITTVTTREMCTVLRARLAPAIGGLRANDRLVAQAQVVLNRWRGDARREYGDDYGGAGAATSLDNVRVEYTVSELVSNIAKLDALLDDATFHGSNAGDAATVETARERLLAVLNKQKAMLNILSFSVESNQGQDLQSKKDPTGGAFGTPAVSMAANLEPVALPAQLYLARQTTEQVENDAGAAVAPIIDACR